jgi:hypothetical protein
MAEVGQISGAEIVYPYNGISFRKQSVTEMRAEEACRSSDKNSLRLYQDCYLSKFWFASQDNANYTLD